jgi:hypothetical protein
VKRFGKTLDTAKFKRHYFTDKAPGASILGAAVYATLRLFTPKDAWSAESLIAIMRLCLMIPIGIIGLIFLRKILARLGIEKTNVDIISTGWILGTSAFHYSTAFYGHQIASVSMMIAVYLQLKTDASDSTRTIIRRALLSGAAAGFSGLTEYQSAVPCLMLFVFVIWIHRRRVIGIAAFALAALPFAVLLLAYHKVAFGGFLQLPYEHLVSKSIQSHHSRGIAGVSIPQAPAVFGSLLSLHRGLFVTSPMFLLVPFGLVLMFRRASRPLAILIGAMFAYYLWFIFSAEIWHAGWAFGPRLLVPIMGLAMIPAAFALNWSMKRPLWLFAALGFIMTGILYHQLVHVVFPEPPEDMRNPVMDLVVPAIHAAVMSPNRAAELSGIPGLWTLIFPAVATLLVLCILIVKSLSKITSIKQRILCLAMATVAPAILAAVVLLVGPSRPQRESDRFIHWMTKLERKEFSDRR